jgi:cation:H+ antiporter
MMWPLIQLLLALLLLDKAAGLFVRGSALMARLLGVSRLLMGALLIGLATNIPEFFVSGLAAWSGHGGLALANPIGSNIVNMGLIFGLCLLAPTARIKIEWLRDHGVPMALGCLLLFILVQVGDIGRVSALLLTLGCALYVGWTVAVARRSPEMRTEARDIAEETVSGLTDLRHQWAVAGTLVLLGMPLVLLSSRWVLHAATRSAALLGVSEATIGFTLVAFGTSLPELFTTLAAIRRGQADTASGIILGSNTFNALGVVGLSGLLGRLPVTSVNRLYDLPMMMLVCCLPLVPVAFGRQPGRATGILLLALYAVYVYALFTMQGVL